LTHIFKYL